MPITFAIGASAGERDAERVIPFEPELRRYLRNLSASKGILLTGLTDLDPYGDARFEGERLSALAGQVDGLLSILEPLYRQEALSPELEPPKVVGQETEPDGKPCGRAGVLHFLHGLKALSREAQERNLPLIALGD